MLRDPKATCGTCCWWRRNRAWEDEQGDAAKYWEDRAAAFEEKARDVHGVVPEYLAEYREERARLAEGERERAASTRQALARGTRGWCMFGRPRASPDDRDEVRATAAVYASRYCAEHPENVKLRVQAEERWRQEARAETGAMPTLAAGAQEVPSADPETLAAVHRAAIIKALKASGCVKQHAAAMLGINRTTLGNQMARLGIVVRSRVVTVVGEATN